MLSMSNAPTSTQTLSEYLGEQVPEQFAEYFGGRTPTITQTFIPGAGWRNVSGLGLSPAFAQLERLQKVGVTVIQLSGVAEREYGEEHVHADFRIDEVFKRARQPLMGGNLI